MKTIALFLETNCEYGREFLKGVADYAHARRDWRLKLIPLVGLENDGLFADCDGIIARAAEPATIARLKATGLPIVDSFCHVRDPELIGVDLDHACVARMAAKFFLRRGFRSFAYCGYRGTSFSDDYLAAFRAALGEAGSGLRTFDQPEPPSDMAFLTDRPRAPKNPRKLEAWLRTLPPKTALFCATDLRAYHVLKLCAKIGRSVPNDVAIMGVDNDTVLCACALPSITSVDPNARAIGYAAARLLNAALTDGGIRKTHPVHRVKPRGIVERESTAIYPVEPKWLAKALAYADVHRTEPLAVSDLERVAGVSHTALNRTFRATFGVSAGRYLLDMKMRKARELLAEGQLLVKEVAAATGFASPQYFCRTYRAYFGQAPSIRPVPAHRPSAEPDETGFSHHL